MINLENKKIFIIGGLGYLGSQLSKKALSEGYSVILYDSLFYGQDYKKILKEIKKNQNKNTSLVFIKGDIRNKKLLEKSLIKYQPNWVFHFGGIVGIYACNHNPHLTRDINFSGAKNVIDICINLNIPLIYNSSSSLYGHQKNNCFMKEGDPLPPPSDLYCKYKLLIEKYIKAKLKSHPNSKIIIFRPATICGPAPRMRIDLLPNHFTYCAVAKRIIKISNPNLYRAIMDINDLMNAYLKIIKKATWKKLIYNIGHYNLSKINCAKKIQKIIPCQLISDPKVGDKRNLRIGCSSFEKEFSFRPKIKFEKSIKNIANWVRKNKKTMEKNNFAGILTTDLKQWKKMI